MAKHSGIKDQGEFFVIDPLSRSVKVPSTHRVIGTEDEHLAEQVTFECPQIIDGHDITQCDRHYVAWRNVENTPGSDNLKLDRIEDGKAYFIWDIRDGLTISKGLVQFSVHFEDTEAPYKWGTTTCKNCEILESINATFGQYKALYVAGDALVIADYTPVDNKTLELDSGGIVPDGVLKIAANGNYNVREFAEAEVAVTPESDPNLAPENIKEGVSIFHIRGTYNPIEKTFRPAFGAISDTFNRAAVYYQRLAQVSDGYTTTLEWLPLGAYGASVGVQEIEGVMVGGCIVVSSAALDPFYFDENTSHGVEEIIHDLATQLYQRFFRVTEDRFVLNLTFGG